VCWARKGIAPCPPITRKLNFMKTLERLLSTLRGQAPDRSLALAATVSLALALLLGPLGSMTHAQADRKVVYVAPIQGIIDLGLAPYVQRVLDQAQAAGAAAVVLDINTFGGRVDAAVQIRDALLNSQVPTIAFVNKRAISAGALISLAAEKIVMSGGGTIGAATPVQAGQPGGATQPVEEKTVSYVRKEFRATAESRKRPPLVAEAMVDADVVIAGVIAKGKLLTLTTDEALKLKIADVRADTLSEALQKLGLGDAEIRSASVNWAENIVRFLTHPTVSSLLITLAMVGILIELRTPGFGLPGAVGVSSLGLFFWGHWIAQLAGLEELLLALAGVLLLAVELLVIPGFGLAGIAGILAILASLALSMMGPGDTPQFIMEVTVRVIFSVLLALVATLGLMRLLPKLPFGKRLVLDTELKASQGFASPPEEDAAWLGKTGRATSPLHPSGIAEIDGHRLDVISEGELIDAGTLIRVVRVDSNRIVVHAVPESNNSQQGIKT
jgi:membrane-bound serine protease (ClpP class)